MARAARGPDGPRGSLDGAAQSGPGHVGVRAASPLSSTSGDARSLTWVHVSRSRLVPDQNSCQGPGVFLFLSFVSLSVQETLMLSRTLTRGPLSQSL